MEKYNLYDSINTTAMRWLAYHYDQSGKDILFYHYNDKEAFNWLLKITDTFCRIYGKTFYIVCPRWKYLYLRYIRRFKKVRLFTGQTDLFKINVQIFIQELLDSFETSIDTIYDIYNTYYRRKLWLKQGFLYGKQKKRCQKRQTH